MRKTYLDKIGHEEVGKFGWKCLSEKKKYDIVYKETMAIRMLGFNGKKDVDIEFGFNSPVM